MKKIIEYSKCCGCSACYNICPQGAIDMVENNKGFKYPKVDEYKCVDCGLCKSVCPVLKNHINNNYIKPYACYNKNDVERLNSSSGGIFILLSKEILKRNGSIFGAALNKCFEVAHTKIDNEEELIKLMGSKYVQSNIGNTYMEVKNDLNQGKYVLFTGTPCQVEGLKSYLGKDYNNLYCQDVICHGVPSPKVWQKYKQDIEKLNNDQLINIHFRNKDNGWEKFCLKYQYENKEKIENVHENIFMQLFTNDIILRDSCYNCSFKNKNRSSDITLADYWGIQYIHPEMHDDKGISLVVVHSKKGQELFDKIRNNLVYKETNLNKAIRYNPYMINSVKLNSKREEFFDRLDNEKFESVAYDAINFGEKKEWLENLDIVLAKKIYNRFLDDESKELFLNRLIWEITGDKKYIRKILKSLECIKKIELDNKKRIIFGAGHFGITLYKAFDNINWECFADNFLQGKIINGLKVISVDELKAKYLDAFIVISPKNNNKEIYEQLKKIGFEESSLLNLGECLNDLEKKRYLELLKDGSYSETIYSNIIKDVESIEFEKICHSKSIFIDSDLEGMEYEILSKLEKLVVEKRLSLAIAINHKSTDLMKIPDLLLKYNPQYKFMLRNYSLDKYDSVLYAFLP